MGNRANKIIGSVFGIGYLPLAPGTFGSIAAVGMYLLIRNDLYLHLTITAVTIVLGFTAARGAERAFGAADPKEFVMDEFSAMLLAYLFVPFSTVNVVTGFLLFRLLDIFKPFPLKRMEKAGNGMGIMLDDLGAGIMTNISLQLMTYFRGNL
jgi:phosphatidylglycerophosphatase A